MTSTLQHPANDNPQGNEILFGNILQSRIVINGVQSIEHQLKEEASPETSGGCKSSPTFLGRKNPRCSAGSVQGFFEARHRASKTMRGGVRNAEQVVRDTKKVVSKDKHV